MVFSLPFPSFKSTIRLQKIVVFGDSLSDNGNVYALTNQTYPIPPYWYGRFSNGPNWVDQLNVSEINNYAHGSATTDNNLVQGYTQGNTILVPGLLQQVELYLNNTNVSTIDFEHTLYIVWGGGNDFLNNLQLYPNMIVASLFKSVQALIDIGAKNILVFNQVPVQYFPFSQLFGIPELFIYLTTEANFYISTFRKALQFDHPQISLEIFDVHSLVLNTVTQNSTDFTNTVDNCWLNANVTTVLQYCSNPNEYFFVDTLHFTSRAHQLVADALRSFLFDSYQVTSTVASTTSVTSTVASIVQVNSNNILVVFFLLQFFHFFSL